MTIEFNYAEDIDVLNKNYTATTPIISKEIIPTFEIYLSRPEFQFYKTFYLQLGLRMEFPSRWGLF